VACEFLMPIAQVNTEGQTVHLPTAPLQPIASADVAAALADVAVQAPANGMLEVGGPEAVPLDALIRRVFEARQDAREVVTDDQARYFGSRIGKDTLIPAPGVRLGTITLAQWLG
jgi:uncharacterized protein YbjT (DUF2867 family)